MILDFIYPRVCCHCHEKIQGQGRLFCQECASQIELASPKGRCRRCFAEKKDKICSRCQKEPSCFHYRAALFESFGVNESFLKLYRKGPSPYVERLLACYLVHQIKNLGWEWPDLILYTRPKWGARLKGERSVDGGVAREVAKLLRIEARAYKKFKNFSLDQIVLYINPQKEIALFPKRLYGIVLRDV